MLNLPPRLGAGLNGSQFANLYTFQAAARHLSFARAAQELCLTPSAVSHRIARLEQGLGLRLFQRLPRQIRLTEEGERIFLILQGTLEQLHEALQQAPGGEIGGALAIYARPSLAACWLVPRLAKFSARYPALTLDVRVGNDSVDFRTQRIDLALYYGRGEFPGLVAEQLMDERIAPVCSPQYAERHGLLQRPEQLRQCTLLHDCLAWDNAAFDAEWAYWGRQRGVELPARHLSFDRSDLCMLAAGNHAGIAIGRYRLVRERLASGELILPFGEFWLPAPCAYYLVHPPREPLPARLQAFIDWLRECAG
ncbi:LysR family transcriptional regulator, D-serine deaminase activator [Pseudomonas benzenivorans]|nr:DNA-binding transcriptional regulator DsdC [Pseudomonas benzenivorans]SDH79561.1 LysR family transcriptional regulator, D-serine deaminase activator [Pseudomonas benzenivorans]